MCDEYMIPSRIGFLKFIALQYEVNVDFLRRCKRSVAAKRIDEERCSMKHLAALQYTMVIPLLGESCQLCCRDGAELVHCWTTKSHEGANRST
jgi:hypothetical protein